MKKTFRTAAGAAALLAVVSAQAQNVTLYGVMDVGVEHVNNVGASGAGLWRMPSNTSSVPSRLGFRGSEPLGSGVNAVFTLEMGILPDTGTFGQGGRAFGRQAFVGISGPWGTVSLGRQYTMIFWSLLSADLIGPAAYSLGSLDAYFPNARDDNSIAWRGTFGGLQLGAIYSLGRDTVNAGPSPAGNNCPGESATEKKACRAWSVLAKYDSERWGAALAYEEQRGRTPASASDLIFGNLNSPDKTDTRLSVNGWVTLGSTKLGAGVVRRDNEGNTARPKNDIWFLEVSQPITSTVSIDAAAMKLKYRNASGFDSTLFALRGNYALSKRTTVYAQVGRITNGGNTAVSVSGTATGSTPALGASQTGFNAGIRHTF